MNRETTFSGIVLLLDEYKKIIIMIFERNRRAIFLYILKKWIKKGVGYYNSIYNLLDEFEIMKK